MSENKEKEKRSNEKNHVKNHVKNHEKNNEKNNERNHIKNQNVGSIDNYSTLYAPGKKGGTYDLPKGGKLIIPEGVMVKKDSVVAGIVSPNKRYLHTPNMTEEEKLHSEIFILDASYKQLKSPIYLHLPYRDIDEKLCEINVRGLWSQEDEWVDVGFLSKKDERHPEQMYAILALHKGGVFAVTHLPKKETFELTPNGSIFSSRLCRYFSLRCPRKAVDKTLNATLEVIPIQHEKLVYCHENYSAKFSDLMDCYEMVDVRCDHMGEFRRPLTIKIPIPSDSIHTNETENLVSQTYDISVLFKETEESEWALIDSTRISRKMQSFDTKKLGRFCVVKVVKGRMRRMKEALSILEDKYYRIPGCISMFVSFGEKLWTAAVACYPREDADYFEKMWENRKFEKINPRAKKDPEKTTHFDIPGKRSEVYKFNDAELFDGLSWSVAIEGSFKIVKNQEEQESKLTFHSHLLEHFFMFHFQPLESFQHKLVGNVTVTPDNIKDEEERSKLSGLFTLEASVEMSDKYFYVEPKPEPKPEPIKEKHRPSLKRLSLPRITISQDAHKLKKEPVLKKTRKVSDTAEAMERLTKCVRKTIISREARVLSGRSLMIISQYVPNGLKLAMQLGLSESCITGLGFDALANGLNMADITYKILLYWKRHIKNYESSVQELALAFKELELPHITNIILNRHANSLEVTKDCFAFLEL